jgi:hypothetical protein
MVKSQSIKPIGQLYKGEEEKKTQYSIIRYELKRSFCESGPISKEVIHHIADIQYYKHNDN